MTEVERRVVEILVGSGVAMGEDVGIRAVCAEMRWSTDECRKKIHDLRMAGKVNWYPIVTHQIRYDPKGQWQVPED